MKRGGSSRDRYMRQRLAEEAARLMVDGNIRDFQQAKRKAAQRLSAVDTRNLPSNEEIEQALRDYQRLFGGVQQGEHLTHLRETALQAMTMLSAFEARLVGPVLNGTAGEHSAITLHVFSDTPESLDLFLMEQGIPFELAERRVKLGPDNFASYPLYRFVAGDEQLELLLFPRTGMRQAPLSPVDGRPMQRATPAMVQELLALEA